MLSVELVVSDRLVDLVRRDEETRRLAADLRREARVAVDVATGPGRSGSKAGTGVEVGRLVLTGVFSAATVQAVASVLRAWLRQRKDSVFDLRRGDQQVTIKGTGAEVDAALARLPDLLGRTEPGD